MGFNIDSLSHFDRLTESLKFMSARACQINAKFTEHPNLAKACIEHIRVNHSVARATVPLMQEVVRCAEASDDPVCLPLIDYMKQHIEEETNHDEWYVRDLIRLGMTREEVFSRIPSPNIAALVGSQYYWINHHHPIAFMGYIACLETYHPTVDYVEKLIKDSGLAAEGFETIMMHAVIDAQHKQDIIDVINHLPLTEEHFSIIQMSAFQTFRYSALIMEDVCKV